MSFEVRVLSPNYPPYVVRATQTSRGDPTTQLPLHAAGRRQATQWEYKPSCNDTVQRSHEDTWTASDEVETDEPLGGLIVHCSRQ